MKKPLKYYESCRLELTWFLDPSNHNDAAGSFESDPMTVQSVLNLLDMVLGADYAAVVTDFDGGLNMMKNRGRLRLTRVEVSSLSKQYEEYWKGKPHA